MTIALSLNMTYYSIASGHAGMAIDVSAQPSWSKGSSVGTLLAVVTNTGNITAQFAAVATGCCLTQSDGSCKTSASISISPASVQTLPALGTGTFVFIVGGLVLSLLYLLGIKCMA